MDFQTLTLLNALNRQFYQTIAASFDETRNRPWSGWANLLPYLEAIPVQDTSQVLDIGCGNGRFGVFLAEHLHHPFFYTGLDNSPTLLDFAGQSLDEKKVPYRLHTHDIIQNQDFEGGNFQLIVLFGVVHHIPGFEQRKALLDRLYQKLVSGGLLIFTLWTFYENERLKKRIIPWDDERVPEAYQQLKPQLEKHDYLLDWRRGQDGNQDVALRYCHYVDREEQNKLTSDMNVITQFDADGSNRYMIARQN